jgi:hypothetical protein
MILRRLHFVFAVAAIAPGMLPAANSELALARREHGTNLLRREQMDVLADVPPAGVLDLVSYRGPLGSMAAYVSSPPKDG